MSVGRPRKFSRGDVYSTYKSLGLQPNQLRSATTPLVSLTGATVWPLGLISLPIRVGSRVIDINFVVVSSLSPYNVILGRAWLHSMKAVTSTLHQVVKFIGWNGWQKSLQGDQLQSKKCYVSTVVQDSDCLEVQCIDTAKTPDLEEVEIPVEERSIEELIKLPLNQDESRYFLIGSSLNPAK